MNGNMTCWWQSHRPLSQQLGEHIILNKGMAHGVEKGMAVVTQRWRGGHGDQCFPLLLYCAADY